MSTAAEPSLDELSIIMNLQLQEAFDDGGAAAETDKAAESLTKETAEEKLMNIINNSASTSARRSNLKVRTGVSARSRRNHSEPLDMDAVQDIDKSEDSRTPPGQRRSSEVTSHRAKHFRRSSSSRILKTSSLDSADGSKSGSRQRNRDQTQSSRRSRSKSTGRHRPDGRARSKSRGKSRSKSTPRGERRERSRSRGAPLRQKSERDSDSARARRTSQSIPSPPASGSSSLAKLNSSMPNIPISPHSVRSDAVRSQRARRSSARSDRSAGSNEDGVSREKRRSSTTPATKQTTGTPGSRSQSFDQVWDDGEEDKEKLGDSDSILGVFFGDEKDKQRDISDTRSVGDRSRLSTSSFDRSLGGGENKNRKTKLEKIHELQAKCDRYKMEWIDATREKKKYKKEFQAKRVEVVALQKEIDTHVTEVGILRESLNEALATVDNVNEDQRRERMELSLTAKELAQERINYAKALNESRELRAELDLIRSAVAEKDRKIEAVIEDLQGAKDKVEELDKELVLSDREILRLEGVVKKIEDELVQYRLAAEKDEEGEGGENLRKVREEMEQKLHTEREVRLAEKQKKLDEKLRHFEEEQEQYHFKQEEREREWKERQQIETENLKKREEERHRVDDEIHQRLKELEDDNAALQGRLKSEQLDFQVRLKSKEEAVATLQKELVSVDQKLKDLDNDPDGAASLKKEAELAKADAIAMKDDLEDAQRHCGILEEEMKEMRTVTSDLRGEVRSLQKEMSAVTKESGIWRRKATEWETKCGEWTDKAHLWKEKAELWEQAAKEADPQASGEPSAAPAPIDPQALFLQAAFEKKKATSTAVSTQSRWDILRRAIVTKTSREGEEGYAQARVQELELENSKQADIIKNLRSEIVMMKSKYKEQDYANQQKMTELQKERGDIQQKNANLAKELELARKLQNLVTSDDDII